MSERKVITINGSKHENPIPTAVKIGNMVYTSAIIGDDPETGEIPMSVEKEIAFIFQHIRMIMSEAEGTVDNIAHLSVYVVDRKLKEKVNVEWLKMFPDSNDRPARHTSVKNLKSGVHVQVEMIAVL